MGIGDFESRLSINSVALAYVSVGGFILLARRLGKTIPSAVNIASIAVLSLLFALFFVQNLAYLSSMGILSFTRFLQYFLAGGLCAFLSHAACTPIDVVKTRLQTSASGKYNDALHCLQSIVKEEGFSVLSKGLAATATGYFLHGAFKYSFYELFKLILIPDASLAVLKPPLYIAALAGFLAECVASVLLCPMEAIRIRSVADPSFPNDVFSGLALVFQAEGLHGLFKGLGPILLKQVPYTVGQFVAFEFSVMFVKLVAENLLGGLESISSSGAAFISLVAGVMAGMFACVISQPGDTILSKINQEDTSTDGSTTAQILRVTRTLGFSGLFLGLGMRLVQVSIMIGSQFLIYDTIKMACGITVASAVPASASVAVSSTVASPSTKN
mmetsp:Transcript_9489/g.17115  ORF Transcript_9489/g.17115 Transcript_9489/m.17115 type:complete len:386 (-) Transcript_9489:2427-3584(-)